MKQCCYKTHREDPCNFPKIDAVATSQLLRGNTEGISNQYPNATGIFMSFKIKFKKNCTNFFTIDVRIMRISLLEPACTYQTFVRKSVDFRHSFPFVVLLIFLLKNTVGYWAKV